MSTDAENTRVVLDAAERIEAIIQKRDTEHQQTIKQIRRNMFRAVKQTDTRTRIQRLADWLNGR